MRTLPCYTCKRFETGFCRKLREYLPNGYAMLFWSERCKAHLPEKLAETGVNKLTTLKQAEGFKALDGEATFKFKTGFLLGNLKPHLTMQIPFGPLRGKRWILGSGLLEMALGLYERRKLELWQSLIHDGDTVLDIGAHVGYYSLAASDLAKEIFAFEPNPRNTRLMQKHLSLNRIRNVNIIQACAGNRRQTVNFDVSLGQSTMGHISQNGSLPTRMLSLDELGLTPNVVKIDVEGAEKLVLQGMANLAKRKPKILLATHGEEQRFFAFKWLVGHGYKFKFVADQEMLAY